MLTTMQRALILAAAALLIPLSSLLASTPPPPAFTFVVLGDRTGSARDNVFQRIIHEAARFQPDFVLGVGDLIEGYEDDPARVNAEWDHVLGIIKTIDRPFYTAPGNHDIFSPESESLFIQRVGKTRWSLQYANALFVFVDNSRWRRFRDWPAEQRRWLRTELRKAGDFQHTFVLMHRPWWRYARDDGRTDTLHQWCVDAGVDYVLTGHDHFYCSARFDGITYIQVGPSGSRYKKYDDPAQGAFQNYLLGRVIGKHLTLTVVEPGHLHDTDIITWDALATLDKARTHAIGLAPVSLGPPHSSALTPLPYTLTIRDLTDTTQTGTLAWDYKATAWLVRPGSLNFLCVPGGSCAYQVHIRPPPHSSALTPPPYSPTPYPLPLLALPYRYAPGRQAVIHKRLPIHRHARAVEIDSTFRLDGALDDSCWLDSRPLAGLGTRAGTASPVERTELFFGFDSVNLYIAIRAGESRMAEIVTDTRKRDGKVYKDDHINVVIDPAPATTRAWAARMDTLDRTVTDEIPTSGPYYQLFVNPLGTVADRRCIMVGDKSERDWSWDGKWQVSVRSDEASWTIELVCPLSAFGSTESEWGVNFVRYQSRLNATGTWQAPFRHDPCTFGTLQR